MAGVQEGSVVKEGQVIAGLEHRDVRMALEVEADASEANLAKIKVGPA